MQKEPSRRGPVRRTFRWCRRSGYVLGLLLAISVLWLNQVGLPEVAKRPLLAQLRERGLNLEFSRMRVRFTRGLVAEHVNLSRAREAVGEQFHAEELQLRLRWSTLLELRAPEVTTLTLRDGRIALPLEDGPGRPPFPFVIENVQARLQLSGPEHWILEQLDATCHGGQFHARGVLTNVSVLRSTRAPKPASTNAVGWRRRLLDAARLLDQTQFAETPDLSVSFQADLRHPTRSAGEMHLRAIAATNRWGRLEGLVLDSQLEPGMASNAPARLTARLSAGRVLTRWANLTGLDAQLEAIQLPDALLPEAVSWEWSCRRTETPWGRSGALKASGRSTARSLPAGEAAPWQLPATEPWAHPAAATNGYDSVVRLELRRPESRGFSNAFSARQVQVELRGQHELTRWRSLGVQLTLEGATSRWAGVSNVQLTTELRPRRDAPVSDETWAAWGRLAPVVAGLQVQADGIALPQLTVEGVQAGLDWRAPGLVLTNLQVRFAGREGGGEGALNVTNRWAAFRLRSELDPRQLTPLLTTNAIRWLRQYEWRPEAPPRIAGEVGVQLPAWTNRHPDWQGEVLPTLLLAASVSGTNTGFRGVSANSAQGRIALTNRVWSVQQMVARRPDGTLTFDYEGDERTHDYHFRLVSTLDPRVVSPLLPTPEQRKALGQLEVTESPRIEGEVWGRWRSPELTGFRAQVAARRVTVRGEPLEEVTGHVSYTNRLLLFRDVHVRSDGEATVPGAAYDIAAQLVSFTNVNSTLPVGRVARVIGPKLTETLSHYGFARPPQVRLEGVVQVKGAERHDLRLDVAADEVTWWRLRATNLTTRLHLKGETITIANLQANGYSGRFGADLFFNWEEPKAVRFRVDWAGTNLLLRELVTDLKIATNRMEGRLSGQVSLTDGITADPTTLAGRGTLRLDDGYLWGVPIFGLFSPIFNALVPGLGDARFTDGRMSFTATNGVLNTRDFEMRSPAMRLQYRGTVDVAKRLDATMEAELFRDTPLIGRLLQFAFTPVTKLLEYRVRGTLTKPEAEPRYIPRFVLMILRPMATLRSLLPKDDKPVEPESTTPPAP